MPAASLREETRALAARIAQASPVTLAIGKQAYHTQIDLDQLLAHAYAKQIMTMNSMAADAQEGIFSFSRAASAVLDGENDG